MKIANISTINPISFGDKVLNEKNQKSVDELRSKFNAFKEEGIPVGDCFYKLPEAHYANLSTADRKYRAGLSYWGNNLIISEKLPNYDIKKAVIEPDGNVFYTPSADEAEVENVEKESLLVQSVNEFLEKVLPKFLTNNEKKHNEDE